jgi:hypothetical protein
MTKLLLALVFAFSANVFAAAPAICPGNQQLAREAIQDSADKRFGGSCRISNLKKTIHWPSKGREGYGADVKCPDTPQRRYSASVQKTNGVCQIRFVTLHPLSGSQCGLSDTWGGGTDEDGEPVGEQWEFDESAEISIGDLTPTKIRALPAIVKQQLIASFDDVTTVEEAVQAVKEGSEAGEGYYKRFTFQGREYDAVESYPGGNAYGTIFKRGESQPVAKEGDGDISCVE